MKRRLLAMFLSVTMMAASVTPALGAEFTDSFDSGAEIQSEVQQVQEAEAFTSGEENVEDESLYNNREDAQELTIGSEYQVSLTETGNEEWYSFTPEHNGEYKIEGYYSDDELDSWVEFYEGFEENHFEECCSDNGKFTMVKSLNAGITYFYRVVMPYAGNFNISFSEINGPVAINGFKPVWNNPVAWPWETYLKTDSAEATVTYSDGTIETIIFGKDGFETMDTEDSAGNYFRICIEDSDGSTVSPGVTSPMSPGTYWGYVEHWKDNEKIISEKKEIIVGVPAAELPAEEGAAVTVAKRSDGYAYCRFSVNEKATYKISNSDNSSIEIWKPGMEYSTWMKSKGITLEAGEYYLCNEIDKYEKPETTEITYTLDKISRSLEEAEVKMSTSSVLYDGAPAEPKVTVTLDGKELTRNKDYTVSYKNNNAPGRAEVIVTGTGLYAGELTAKFEINLKNPPLKPAVSMGYNSMKVGWEPVPGAETYNIYYREAGVSKWTKIATGITDTEYIHKSSTAAVLKTDTKYEYTVRAVAGRKMSGYYTDGASGTPVLESTSATAEAASYSSLKITWNAVDGAQGYQVYMKTGGHWKRLAILKGGTSTSYIHTDSDAFPVEIGVKNEYRVRAYRREGTRVCYSSFSRSAYAAAGLGTPNLKVTPENYSRIRLSWDRVDGATGYSVYVKVDDSWKKMKTTSATSYVHKDTSIIKVVTGQKYEYKVKAYRKADGKLISSGYSQVISGIAVPEATELVSVKPYDHDSIEIKWKKAAGASGYIIYRRNGAKWEKVDTVKGNLSTGCIVSDSPEHRIYVGTEYTYTVRAYAGAAKGGYNKKGMSTKTFLEEPHLSYISSKNIGILLGWATVYGARGYQVFRYDNGEWVKIGSSKTINYIDKNVEKGKTYQYKVRAICRDADSRTVYSPFSVVKSITR